MVEQSENLRKIFLAHTDQKNEIYSMLLNVLYSIYTSKEVDSKTSSEAKSLLD